MELTTILILFWVGPALIIGSMADSKNHSAAGFFLLSIFFSPIIGIIAVLIVPHREYEQNKETKAKDYPDF